MTLHPDMTREEMLAALRPPAPLTAEEIGDRVREFKIETAKRGVEWYAALVGLRRELDTYEAQAQEAMPVVRHDLEVLLHSVARMIGLKPE